MGRATALGQSAWLQCAGRLPDRYFNRLGHSGLRLQRLQEHPHLNREVEYAIYENQTAQMPLCYTLVAEAP